MTERDLPRVHVAGRELGGGRPFVVAGPCVLETRELTLEIGARLAELAAERDIPLVFKASFDKANRTSASAVRGPGVEQGLEWLDLVRARTGLPLLTDVHLPDQCATVAEVVDVLQIPAFLCRQTDLLVAAAETGRAINIKKGQFLAPWDMVHATRKCEQAGGHELLVTERGSSFGFGRLVVDMTGFDALLRTGHPIVFDATHSVQQPGGAEGRTGGDRSAVPALARAAAGTGLVDGFFFEVHPDPDRSPSDGPNMVVLADFGAVLDGVLSVHAAARGNPGR